MRPPPDCRPSVGASAPKGTCRWLSPFGGSVVRTALNYNYHRAAGRILCRRLKYATGYLLKLTPPSCKKASPAPIRTMKVRGNENWSKKSSISTREATPAPIRTMKVRANENWSEISTRKASPAPIRTMKVRGNENWYEKSSISTSNRQPAPIRTMKVRGIENWYEKSSISTSNRQPVRGIVEKKKRSVRGVVDLYVATVRPSDRRNYRRKIFPATFPAIGFVAVFEFFQQFSDKNCCVVAENGRVMRGMTWILRGLGVAVYWESAWYTEMSPRASFHPVAEENGRVMTWADMDSPRPWVAVRAGCYVVRVSRRHIQFTFCGCSWQPSFDGKWISAGSDTRLPVLCVSFALRLRYPQPRLDGPEYFGGVGERLMFLGQLNVRRMSGDRIASVCRLRARAPNYLPPILLSYFTGDVTLDDRIRGLFKKLVVEPWDGSAGPPLVCTGRLVPSVGDTLLVFNWPGRASGAVTLKKLECSKQAYALDTLAWDNIIGFRSYCVGLRDRKRKLGARRRSDTVLVSTINDADQGSADVAYRTPLAPYEKSKFLGSGGSMVARLKLKGIDGRAPPGVEPAA
ncbi:hypothetical protein ISN44_Un146g000120 [Arabidopsis suecica]|uniref:Uncharacterized protein n=1 Tax=Arabidopsis suecica TaxID=45249 RepID=A0A8T1XG58_ARASU|nr:hypothetical protein ISN44_Un146g000120 [Arabidopsis suecica]